MAELLKLLEAQDAFKSEQMEALLSQSLSQSAKIGDSTTTSTTSTRNANLNTTTTSNINANKMIIDNSNVNTGGDPTTNRNLTGASNISTAQTTTSSTSTINNNAVNINQQFFYLDPRSNSVADIQQVLAKVQTPLTDIRRLLVDQITDQATQAHITTTLNTNANIREANERIARQQSQGDTPAKPDMSKMAKEPSAMMKHFLNSMVPSMERVVDFSRKLPGFSDLATEDQVKLLQQGMFEVMLARISLLIDPVKETMIDPSLKMKKPRAMVRKMPPLGPFIDQFFDIAKVTSPLNLTDGENGLFMAILMISPDRTGLKNTSGVQALQQLYLQSLYQLLRHNHSDADSKFSTLLSTVHTIRKVNDEHFRFVHNMKRDSAEEFEKIFPQLHRELFDTSLH